MLAHILEKSNQLPIIHKKWSVENWIGYPQNDLIYTIKSDPSWLAVIG